MTPAPNGTEASPNRQGDSTKEKDRLWPILITAGLALVIVVNAIFIYIAVSGADDVVPSYHTEKR